MVDSSQFKRLVYNRPDHSAKGDEIETMDILGIDSEALDNGEPFLYCISDGIPFPHEKDIIPLLFKDYSEKHFCVYNLKYDSGAILYWLPDDRKEELWLSGKTYLESEHGVDIVFKNKYYNRQDEFIEYEKAVRGFMLEYIPHKNLRISKGSTEINFWDIAQYFRMSLDKASQTYLNDRKKDIETKTFTKSYVKENLRKIVKYCIHDAKLAEQLGRFLVDKLKQFGIRTTALYSNASLSYRYFCDRDSMTDSWRFWKHHKELLHYAIDSYEGGKFEITKRGSFTGGLQYDIISAYPYEISNLADVNLCKITKSKSYEKDAYYGFVRVRIYNKAGLSLPCGLIKNNVRVYPAGAFFCTITKQELDFLRKWNIDHEIISGYWLWIEKPRFIYRKTILELFDLKAKYKGKDVMLTNCAKTMANSIYGKFCQCIDQPDKSIKCGQAWHPIHASIITANTRCKVAEVQNQFGSDCIAVHTDSVLLLRKPKDKEIDLSGKLGSFDLQNEGDGVMIACGQYQIGDKCAFKGFEPENDDSWTDILSRSGRKESIDYNILHVESWVEAVAKGHYGKINLFQKNKKKIDFNADTKRIWLEKANAHQLLTEDLQNSIPLIFRESKEPQTWQS